MSTSLKIGLIGGGMIGQIAHLPFYLRDHRCQVAAVAEQRPSLIRYLREMPGIGRIVADHRQLLADPDISAVVIVAPRPATGPLVLEALRAGKDVLAEKPLAHTVAQAAELVTAAEAAGRLLGAAYMKRHDPGVQAALLEVRQLQETRRLGPLMFSRFYDYARDYAFSPPPHKRPEESRASRYDAWPTAPSWMPSARAAEYAWFMNAASHDVNLMRYFFPAGLRLSHAQASGNGALTAVFDRAGSPVLLEVVKSASGVWLQGAEFVFEKGRLLLEVPSPMDIGRSSRVTVHENADTPSVRDLPVEHVWSFALQAQSFVDKLMERRPLLTSGAEALEDLKLIESLWRRICNQEESNVE